MINLKSFDDIIISAGHKNFHMLFTAAEMYRRGRLSQVICGAYPTLFEQVLLSSPILRDSKKLNRFLNRKEKLPLDKISQSRYSEILSSFSGVLSKFRLNKENINVKAFKIYGKKAEKVISKVAGVKVYHYRAGFGQSSVSLAKDLGIKTICDHSIVHPSLLNLLIESKGIFPKCRPNGADGIWNAVLDDIEQADFVIVNSDFVAKTFRYMGFDDSKLAVVYQGVEDKFINILPKSRSYYNLDSNRPIRFLFAGGIIPRKGIDEILLALKELPSNKIELHLAGSLPDDSKKRYAELLSDSRVKYHGMLSQKEIALLMSQSDVFLFPSRAEGSARVIFEAMAAGCAVICTENAGSVIKDGFGGKIISPNNKEELLNSIYDVLNNPAKYVEFGKFNKKLIFENYRQVNYGDELEKIYSIVQNDF